MLYIFNCLKFIPHLDATVGVIFTLVSVFQLATFQAGANVSQPGDISDGVIIATVLHEM